MEGAAVGEERQQRDEHKVGPAEEVVELFRLARETCVA